jgi:hypothetical protein
MGFSLRGSYMIHSRSPMAPWIARLTAPPPWPSPFVPSFWQDGTVRSFRKRLLNEEAQLNLP